MITLGVVLAFVLLGAVCLFVTERLVTSVCDDMERKVQERHQAREAARIKALNGPGVPLPPPPPPSRYYCDSYAAIEAGVARYKEIAANCEKEFWEWQLKERKP